MSEKCDGQSPQQFAEQLNRARKHETKLLQSSFFPIARRAAGNRISDSVAQTIILPVNTTPSVRQHPASVAARKLVKAGSLFERQGKFVIALLRPVSHRLPAPFVCAVPSPHGSPDVLSHALFIFWSSTKPTDCHKRKRVGSDREYAFRHRGKLFGSSFVHTPHFAPGYMTTRVIAAANR